MKAFIFTRHFAATALVGLLTLGSAIGEEAPVAKPEFALRDNDRVLFLGDSITEQKLYTTYIEAYAVTRFPKLKLAFANRGWGGDTAWMRMRSFPDEKVLFAAEGDAQQKLIEESVDNVLIRDVVTFKPTIVLINYGMNDCNREPFREDLFRAYVRGQKEIVKVLTKNGARPILLTPQPLEPRIADPASDPRNQSLRKFADGLKEIAAKQNLTFLDQFDPYLAILKREHAQNANVNIGGGDEIHPAPVGHTIMASILLKQLNAPALVSRVELDFSDAQNAKLVNATKCTVANIKAEKGALVFERSDEALPMPVDERAADALKLTPLLDDLNRYELKVTGLPADRYDVLIDDDLVTTLTKQEMAKGWNLAVTAGPITTQAQEVLALIFKKNVLGQTLWEAQIHNRKKQLAALPAQVAELETQITAACQPKTRRFTIKPSGS
jgi:lysophospholipase L1-like esterase